METFINYTKENSHINESGVYSTARRIDDKLSAFLKDVVIPASKGYVKDERDAALLLYQIMIHKYNI